MTDPFTELTEAVLSSLTSEPPHVVGIGGAVSVGKSTVAGALAHGLSERGRRVEIVATDAFLYPNRVLEDRGITMRKGFPESYDFEAVVTFLNGVRDQPVIEIPVYSHATYDIVPGEVVKITDADIVILEGVVALQSPIVEAFDVAIYVDADESAVRQWFIGRFIRWTDEARSDPTSFYRMFADMPDDQVRQIAEATWDGINGVNLAEHILPSRENATFVLQKTSDHSIRRLVRMDVG